MGYEYTAREMKALSAEGEVRAGKVDNILEKCKQAANQGNYSIYWYDLLSRQAKNKLHSLGFKVVEHDDQRDGYSAYISWN